MSAPLRSRLWLPAVVVLCTAAFAPAIAHGATALTETPGQLGTVKPNSVGLLDCNGLSPIQSLARYFPACADVHNPISDDGRFTDNGRYVGHDEPDLNFKSSKPGSGNNVTWNFTIGEDPTAAPTDKTPGADVSHWFELTPAMWLSMGICDPQSYPILPCTPNSDKNAPSGRYPGGGSAFLELQFYPPGFAPFVDSLSLDNSHWGAALVIWSLEATAGFTNLNFDCAEPGNHAFIQTNGVPTGPPSPQLSDLASSTPNTHTLLMNPGDRIQVHIFDAPVPNGGGHALETVVTDLTTHQKGYMQASAANGFMNTSIVDCSGTPFNFEPEYNTAAAKNVTPWGAGTEVISASFETGHFEPCVHISDKGLQFFDDIKDPFWSTCSGPYEKTTVGGEGNSPEFTDAPCYPKGDMHNGLAAGSPDTITGCTDFFAGGDLDFDGPPYWTEWPTATTPTTTPGAFKIKPPVSAGSQYDAFQFQTDLAFSELTTCEPESPQGCAVPPPNAPGNFYPYWTLAGSGNNCIFEFGQMSNGNSYGGDAQYGSVSPNLFPDFIGPFHPNSCTS